MPKMANIRYIRNNIKATFKIERKLANNAETTNFKFLLWLISLSGLKVWNNAITLIALLLP